MHYICTCASVYKSPEVVIRSFLVWYDYCKLCKSVKVLLFCSHSVKSSKIQIMHVKLNSMNTLLHAMPCIDLWITNNNTDGPLPCLQIMGKKIIIQVLLVEHRQIMPIWNQPDKLICKLISQPKQQYTHHCQSAYHSKYLVSRFLKQFLPMD